MKTYEDLMEQITLDEELLQEFQSAVQESKNHPEEFVAWAKEKGYAVTTEELLADSSDPNEIPNEISDEELETVIGGTRYYTIKDYKPVRRARGGNYCPACKCSWSVSMYTHMGTMRAPYGCPGFFPTPEWEYWLAYWESHPDERYLPSR